MLVREGCQPSTGLFCGLSQLTPMYECIGIELQEQRSHSDRPSCGLECLNALNVYSFQMQFDLPTVWPNQHFYVSVSFLAFCNIFVLCRSQCESEPSPNISFQCYVCFPFIPDLYKMCHFVYFSSVEACLPGNTVLKLCSTIYTQMCQKCHFQ